MAHTACSGIQLCTWPLQAFLSIKLWSARVPPSLLCSVLRVCVCMCVVCVQVLHVSRKAGIKDSQVSLPGEITALGSPSHVHTPPSYCKCSFPIVKYTPCLEVYCGGNSVDFQYIGRHYVWFTCSVAGRVVLCC